jgi:transcriptional regulator with XRE-family HTH domain
MSNRIKELRKIKGLTQEQLAEAVGMSHAYILRIERGERNLSSKWTSKISEVLGVSESELFPQDTLEMPILGYVGAGDTVNIEHIDIDNSQDMTPRPSGMPKDSIAFRVKGDSMRPMLRDDDLILCLPQSQNWQNLIGELCVVKTSENEIYIKELRKGYEEGTVRLISYNQLIDPIENVKPIWVSRVAVMVKVEKVAV